jgi:hypothetical protein
VVTLNVTKTQARFNRALKGAQVPSRNGKPFANTDDVELARVPNLVEEILRALRLDRCPSRRHGRGWARMEGSQAYL